MWNRVSGFPRFTIEPSEPTVLIPVPPEIGVETSVFPRLNRGADSEYDVGYVGGGGGVLDGVVDGGLSAAWEYEPVGLRSER